MIAKTKRINRGQNCYGFYNHCENSYYWHNTKGDHFFYRICGFLVGEYIEGRIIKKNEKQ